MPSFHTLGAIWEPHHTSTILEPPQTLKPPSRHAKSPLINNYIPMPFISQSSSLSYGDRPQGAGRIVDIPKSCDILIVTFDEVTNKIFGTDAMINPVDSALDIGNHGMDQRQELDPISPVIGNHRLMFTIIRIHNTYAGQPSVHTTQSFRSTRSAKANLLLSAGFLSIKIPSGFHEMYRLLLH